MYKKNRPRGKLHIINTFDNRHEAVLTRAVVLIDDSRRRWHSRRSVTVLSALIRILLLALRPTLKRSLYMLLENDGGLLRQEGTERDRGFA